MFFSDIHRQLTFPAEFISDIGTTRLGILETKGLVTLEEVSKEIPFVEKSLISDIKEFAFGETGKKFVGIGVPGVSIPLTLAVPGFPGAVKPFISLEQISTAGKEFVIPEKERIFAEFIDPIARFVIPEIGAFVPEKVREEITITGLKGLEFGVQTGATLIPTTPGEVAIHGAVVGALFVAPPFVTIPLGAVISGLGARAALDIELTPQERVAGGLVAVGGAFGVAAGTIPFLRGRLSGFGRPIKTAPEGFRFIAEVDKFGDIGLIQPGKGAKFVDLPITSPLRRGGFGRRPGIEKIFLSTEQVIATSQRGLFKVGKDILIEKPFFVTPAEPFLKIGETRVSRLGLIEPFKFPKDIEIGFGFPKKPQIGITIGEVGKIETTTAFELGKGTELEAFKTRGIITDILKIGKTRIKGQAIDIFEFKVGKPGKLDAQIDFRRADLFRTTERSARVSGESLITSLFRTTKGIGTGIITSTSLPKPSSFSLTISKPSLPTTKPSPPVSLAATKPSPPISPPMVSPPTIGVSRITLPRRPPTFFPPRRLVLREKEKREKKRKPARALIRPSLTAIVLGIEAPAIVTEKFGVAPFSIRGLKTSFEFPRRTKKKKGKRNKFDMGFTDI